VRRPRCLLDRRRRDLAPKRIWSRRLASA
jgi:hypothetical protein